MEQVQQFATYAASRLQDFPELIGMVTLYGSLLALLGGCWSLGRRGSYKVRNHVRTLERRILTLEAKLTRAEINQQIFPFRPGPAERSVSA